MFDELRNNDWLPRSVRRTARTVEAAMSKAEQELGRSANESEVAAQMKISLEGYQGILRDLHGSQLIYYHDFDRAADDEPFLDRFCADPADPLVTLIDENLRTALIAAIEALPEREKMLMSLCYEHGMVLREISAVMEGVNRECRNCIAKRSRACERRRDMV